MNGPGDPNQGGYPPQGGGYPPQGGGYPPQPGQPGPGGYPPNPPYPPRQGGNNTALLVTLIVLVVALIAGGAILYFTGAFGGGTNRPNVAVSTPAPVTPAPLTAAPRPTPAPPVATSGGNVAELLQMGVAQMQPQIPIRNGPATITAVSSIGTVLTMEMEINQPIAPAEWDQLQASFQQNLCAGQFRNAIQMGASAQVEVTDSVGSSRTYNIASC